MVKQQDDKKQLKVVTGLLALAADRDDGEVRAECLAAEELALLVEGGCAEQELSSYRAHLGKCDSCYREWLLLQDGEVKRDRPSPRNWAKKYSYIGSALALAASIAVFLNVWELGPVYMLRDEAKVIEEVEAERQDVPILKEGKKDAKQAVSEESSAQVVPSQEAKEQPVESGKTVLSRIQEKKQFLIKQKEKVLKKEKEIERVDIEPEKRLRSVSEVENKERRMQDTEQDEPSQSAQSARSADMYDMEELRGAAKAENKKRRIQETEKNWLSKPAPSAPSAVMYDMAAIDLPEFKQWAIGLSDGCVSELQDGSYWKQIYSQAQQMYQARGAALDSSQRSLLKKLLPILNRMAEEATSEQCEEIMVILAEQVESR